MFSKNYKKSLLVFAAKFKILFVFLLLPYILIGQNLNFYHFTEDDGYNDQADFEIKITQDRSGFLWLPNLNGLYRYDGRAFREFKHNPNNPNGLSTNTTRVVFEDSDGKIWIGTGNGIHIYDPITDQFEHLLNDPEDPESLCGNDVRSIAEDRDGNIWIGALSRQICVCDKRDRKFKMRHQDVGDINFLQQKDGTIWVTGTYGMYKYAPQQDTFTRYTNVYGDGHSMTYGMINLFEDSSGIIWYTSKRIGMGRLDPISSTFSPMPDAVFEHFNRKKSASLSLFQARDGSVWYTHFAKVIKYDPQSKETQSFPHLPEVPSSCQNGHITTAFQDRAGSIWFSAMGGSGLSVVHSPDNSFEVLPIPTNINENMLLLDEKRLLSFGERQALVYDLVNESISPYKLPNELRNNWNSPWVWISPDNTLWWLSRDGKSTKGENLDSGKQFSIELYGWLRLDRQGNLWYIQSQYYDKANAELINYKDKILAVDSSVARKNEVYNYVMVDSRDRVWLNGSLGGLICYDKSNDEVTIYSPDANDPSAVISGPADLIFEGSNGWIYILTSDGMSVYQEEHDRFIQLGLSEGLPQALHVAAIEDNQQNIWLGLSKGLCRIDPTDFSIQLFNENDGLPIGVFTQTMLKDHLGRIYFTKGDKSYRFQPELLQPDTTAFPIVLTDFYLNRKKIQPGQDSTLLSKTIQYTEQLTLKHSQSDFGFRFVSPDFRKGDELEYFYQLENYDKDWVSIGNNIEVHFTNIPKGNYRFKLKAKTPTGNWTPEFQELAIKVLPAWWETWWFYSLCILAIASLVFTWIYRLRSEVKRATKKIREDKEIIEQQAEKLKELDQAKSKFFTNISHEFRTLLTIISGMVDNIRSKPKDWTMRGTTIIKQNTLNLLNLINQILDLRKLESKNLHLSLMQGNIVEYLRYLTVSYQSYAENKGLEMHFLPSQEKIIMDYDPDKIMRIISNLLSNAIKYNRAEGHIYFYVEKIISEVDNKEFLQLSIQDTGAGIPKEKLNDIFSRFYQVNEPGEKKVVGSGIGLALAYELVQLMKGKIKVNSEEGVGTSFIVKLPIARTANISSAPAGSEMPILEDEIITTVLPEPGLVVQKNEKPTEDLPHLLIVEDNPQIVQILITCLEDHYRLEVATNGQIGIDKAIEQVPDIIISDVMMPEKNGYELTDALKNDERTDHIPIILLTAKSDIDSKISGLQKGADAYMAKPFEKRELLVRINNLLGIRKKLQERYATLSPSVDEPPVIEDPFLQKLYDYIEEHLSDATLNMDKISRALGMSRTQVFRKLKALTGKSATLFIRSIRLQKGKKLLHTTDLTISEVAYDVGFTSLSYFSTAFMEEFGVRPSSFRK